jgi:hypothetical protein
MKRDLRYEENINKYKILFVKSLLNRAAARDWRKCEDNRNINSK